MNSSMIEGTNLPSRRYLPLLLLLFVGSGCSALVYEVVWLQLLQLVIGSSAVSLGVLLGTFMGGMCLGSLLLPSWIAPHRHPLRVYAVLELGIGICGILLLFGMPYINRIYMSNVGHGMPNVLLRGVVCMGCLLPPTVLMGATLPAIARWMEATRQDISYLGFFYGANIVGAVFGCLLAGFYLLRVHDLATATYVAAGMNGLIGLVGLLAASYVPHRRDAGAGAPSPDSAVSDTLSTGSANWSVYLTIGLSGVCSLGAEVIWTRQLSLMLGATVYTFSIILAVFLLGLGLGSSVGAAASRSIQSPRLGLATCQLLIVLAVAWTAYQLAESLPYWPIDVSLSKSAWFGFQLDLLRCLWAFLPASFLWGASFPLALAAAASRGQDTGRLVGRMYAANTVGAIVGALGFSLLGVSWLGTQQAQQAIMVLAALSSFLIFAVHAAEGWQADASRTDADRRSWLLGPPLLSAAAAMLVLVVPPSPLSLIGYGRNLPTWDYLPKFVYSAEGMNASFAVSEANDGIRNFHVSGKVVASTEPQDMRIQRMLGHIPALIHPAPKSVLVVGCGAGVTAGSFLLHPTVERIVVCEIEPLIPPAATKYFGSVNYQLLEDPRVEVVHDDARHFVATSAEKFDVITSDPIHPWVKGAASLYSTEYFELCKRRVTPDGVICQWVPLYETSLEAVQTELATFFQSFPGGTIWSNDEGGEGYDIILIGQNSKTVIDADQLHARLDRRDHQQVLESLREVSFASALNVLITYTGRAADLTDWLRDAEINHDHNLRLQFLAGLGLNRYESDRIYDSMVAQRSYPADLFPVRGTYGSALKEALQLPGGLELEESR